MSTHESRITHLEAQVEKHLEEAGEVREAIKDLRKAVEIMSSRMWGVILGSVTTLLAMVGFLLRELLRK